ncbi:MAG: hypothetical protein U0930_20930 [Pirellulales bacterium]
MAEQLKKTKQFGWVRLNDKGEPSLRKLNVSFVVLVPLCVFLASQVVLSFFFDTPFRPWIVSAFFSGYLFFVSTLIELQRQNFLREKPSFRFDLRYLFLATVLAAVFFGSITAQIRDTQLGFRISEEVKTRIQGRINGVDVFIGGERGKKISCLVNRSSFSDHELKELLELTSSSDAQTCELVHLVLEGTQVSDDGVRELSVCRKLEFLALPSIALSDATIVRIGELQSLKYLTFDENKTAEQQRTQIYQKLPNTTINGRTYLERKSAQRN